MLIFLNKSCLVSILLVLCLTVFPLNISAESNYNWNQIIKSSQKQLQDNKKDIVLNYTLAVAYANTGEIIKAYEIIDVFGSSVSRQDFNTALSPYLRDWENYQNQNDLLLLNYAAFREVINENYIEAVSLFEYIYQIDPQNLWALNHAAAALAEAEDYKKALSYANEALSIKKNEYSHLIKGVVYFERGNYVRALLEAASSSSLFRALVDDEYQDFAE